jgi:hypothetical protein
MKVAYEGKEYELDLDEIDVKQARTIKAATGLTVMQVQRGMLEVDPDAMVGLFWYMKVTNGETCNIRTVNFKLGPFSESIVKAIENELSDDEREEMESATGVTLNKRETPKDST